MARVTTYLNFPGTAEEAFKFYRTVFGGEFGGEIHRFGDIPPSPDQPPLPEADKNKVMHIELSILGGHILMGSDSLESMGYKLVQGNNVNLNLEPDTRADTDRLFKALSDGANVETPLQDMFWGGYFGTLTDKFGIHWMVNCTSKT